MLYFNPLGAKLGLNLIKGSAKALSFHGVVWKDHNHSIFVAQLLQFPCLPQNQVLVPKVQ